MHLTNGVFMKINCNDCNGFGCPKCKFSGQKSLRLTKKLLQHVFDVGRNTSITFDDYLKINGVI